MFSDWWKRWKSDNCVTKSGRGRRSKRRSVQPSLESLERRELLTTATPFFLIAQPPNGAAPSPLEPPTTGTTPLAGIQPHAGSGPAGGFAPSQISQAYGFNQISFNGVAGNGSGQTIAIVDAYDDPNINSDLQTFDAQFGLPNPTFTVLNQNGGTSLPGSDSTGGWEVEESLDVEWAHAMAPAANIVLVEANSADMNDLLTAVQTAAGLPGVVVVSMSWGGGESPDEATAYDSYFTTPAGHPGVSFIVSSGDNGAPPSYPAASPNVLAVGGTTLTVDSQNNYVSESGWSGSGGGLSAYEAQPSYQQGIVTQSSTQRQPGCGLRRRPQYRLLRLR